MGVGYLDCSLRLSIDFEGPFFTECVIGKPRRRGRRESQLTNS